MKCPSFSSSEISFSFTENERRGGRASRPKNEQVYLQIRDMIFHNILKPGQKLMEDELATLLQTSRTPVREALRKLSSEGLITIYPKRYADVTYFTAEMIKKLGVVRMSQDILSGHLAIYYGSDAEFAHLQQLADTCEVQNKTGDLCARITADRSFHLGITEIAKNELLSKYQQEIYFRIHLIHLQNNSDDTVQRISYHSTLIDCLRQRDQTAYANAVCRRCQEMYHLDDKIIGLYLHPDRSRE